MFYFKLNVCKCFFNFCCCCCGLHATTHRPRGFDESRPQLLKRRKSEKHASSIRTNWTHKKAKQKSHVQTKNDPNKQVLGQIQIQTGGIAACKEWTQNYIPSDDSIKARINRASVMQLSVSMHDNDARMHHALSELYIQWQCHDSLATNHALTRLTCRPLR